MTEKNESNKKKKNTSYKMINALSISGVVCTVVDSLIYLFSVVACLPAQGHGVSCRLESILAVICDIVFQCIFNVQLDVCVNWTKWYFDILKSWG